MRLPPGGIDLFYIDESHDSRVYIATAVRVPMLRNVDGEWDLCWPEQYEALRLWRKSLSVVPNIPVSKELHGVKFASGRGFYNGGEKNFPRVRAVAIYRELLASMDFLTRESVLSVAATRACSLYGSARLEATMHALFQRMRKMCKVNRTAAMVFFDQGHPEYRKLYRRSQVYLPTGSMIGSWREGQTKNLPLDMFIEDGNEKNSKHCYFTQVADMIAYAAFLKIKSEVGELSDWQSEAGAERLYDSLQKKHVNLRVSNREPRDGIVRLG